MAKRRRRNRTPNLPRQQTLAPQPVERKQVNLAEQYAYVVADLGRIALISAVMLAGLVALSFILR